jgi:hypothetical protein
MRKRLAVFAFTAAAVLAVAAPSWAVTLGGSVASTATVTVGGTSTATFTLDLRDTSAPLTDTNPPQITWSGVLAGTTGWKIANQLLLLNATVTDAGGGIEIYTNNTIASASPRYTPTVTPATNPAGLVAGDGVSAVSMAWSIKASSKVVEGGPALTGLGASDPNSGPITGRDNKFQWLFFKDRASVDDPATTTIDESFADGQKFVTMINVVGLHFGQADDEFGIHTDGANSFVYLQANFGPAGAGVTYGTNKLIVHGFTS